MEEQEIARSAQSWPARAEEVRIADQNDYDYAVSQLSAIKELRAAAEAHHRPIIASAHETHRRACEALRTIDEPLNKAESIIKLRIAAWTREQKMIEEQRKRAAEEAARQQMLEQIEVRIERAEARGASVEEVQAIMNQPVIVPRPVPTPPTFTPSSQVRTQAKWAAKVTDIKALCRAIADGHASPMLVQPNMVALNQMARAMRTTMNVPGVQAVQDAVVAVVR